jgi:hypothetical protein
VTTFTDGTPPSVTPEPDDGSVPHRAEAPDPDPDAGSAWLHDEIQRRIAEKAAAGGTGRHARRGGANAASSAEYVARHSVATPGPGAPRPGPVGGQMSQASELLRRERTEGSARPVWSGPPARPAAAPPTPAPPTPTPPAAAQPAPGLSDPEAAPAGSVRPGVAAAAAMRGAARGRARKAANAATTSVTPIPPVDDATAPAPPRPAPAAPADAQPPDQPATAPADPTPADGVAPTGPLPASPPAAAEPPSEAVLQSAPTRPTQAVTPRLRPVVPDPVEAELTAPVPPVPPAPAADEPPGGPEQPAITVPEQRGAELRGAPSPPPDPPAPQGSKRVRVVLAERKSVARPVRTVITIQESSGVGELLRTNLIGSQLAIALRFAIGAGLTLGLLPLLFAMVPEIGRVEVLGIRLPWLLLGVLVYPFLFGLGLWHTRTAEHLEQNFAETVQD